MTSIRTRSLLAAALLATAVLGACGSDDDDATTLGNEAPAAQQDTDDGKDTETDKGKETTDDHGDDGDKGDKGGAAAATVELQGTSFDPDDVEVKVGDTVVWTWKDSALHNVTGGPLKSGNKSGGEYRYTFTEAGEFDYVCTLHPGMEGTVTVS